MGLRTPTSPSQRGANRTLVVKAKAEVKVELHDNGQERDLWEAGKCRGQGGVRGQDRHI